MLQREKSEAIYQSSLQLIPGGVNSPVRCFPGLGQTPLIAARGKGDLLWDVDGKQYVDFCGSWGALILGHAPDRVVQAVREQVAWGSSFGLPTGEEERLAKKIVGHIPSIEKIRFVSSGTEATMSALRLARGYTHKSVIVKFDGNYHGHSDGLLVKAGSGVAHMNQAASSKGIPEEFLRGTVSLPYNDTEGCERMIQGIEGLAAVIVEPIAGNMGVVPAKREFLEMLRRVTYEKGALLIFDEVISGFRVGLAGAQGLYGIKPDLTCLGKIIGGGFPAAAFGGRTDVMDHLAPLGQVYQAGTLSGNPVAMRAGFEVLLEIEREGFYEELERKTASFLAPIEKGLRERGRGCVQRVGSMFTLFLDRNEVRGIEDLGDGMPTFSGFFRSLFERGVYIPPSPYEAWFISAAHTEENLEYASRVIVEMLG